jgi:hypothetical protein
MHGTRRVVSNDIEWTAYGPDTVHQHVNMVRSDMVRSEPRSPRGWFTYPTRWADARIVGESRRWRSVCTVAKSSLLSPPALLTVDSIVSMLNVIDMIRHVTRQRQGKTWKLCD